MNILDIIKEEFYSLIINENEYTPSDDELNIARKTSRTQRYSPDKIKGRGFGEAVVPSFAIELANKNDTILDFGAGKHPYYVLKYRDLGYNIYGWDLPESMSFWEQEYPNEDIKPKGLNHQFDLVYASNVLNVAPNENFLRNLTLNYILKALKSNGTFIGNFPLNPRKNPEMTTEKMYNILKEYFNDVEYIKNKKIFICKNPI